MLKNGLVFKKTIVNVGFRLLNSCIPKAKPCSLPLRPRKILLSNLGNIGDLFIAAKAIFSLQASYKDTEWGLLISSRAKAALPLLGSFANIYVYDPWYYSESKAALHCFKSEIIRQIRNENYDMAIDLQPFYPNAVSLFRRTKIPVRLGYSSAGFGASLTHPFSWKKFENYLGDLHLDHLREVGIPLIESPFSLKSSESIGEKYLVIHMCSSRVEKDWKREEWIKLIKKLSDWTVVLTGHGKKDNIECEWVAAATGCLNFCNQTNMVEYATVLQKAKGFISVDSMGVHLAALLNIPTFVLFSDAEYPPLWRPPNSHSTLMRSDSIENIVAFVHSECL